MSGIPVLIPDEPLRSCFKRGHKVDEDMAVYNWCKERLFYCYTCMKAFICEEVPEEGRLRIKKILKLPASNKEIAKYLTWEVEGEEK